METISRRKAIEQGLKRYFTGKPCKNEHVAERFTSIRGCVECCRKFNAENFSRRYADPSFVQIKNAKSRAWASNNPEKNREKQRKWRAANPHKHQEYNARRDPEKTKAHSRAARAKNPKKAAAHVDEWKRRNPERVRALNQVHKSIRRTREKATGGSFTADDIEALHKEQSGRCAVCPCTTNLEVDHVHPIVLGGSSDPSNLQLLCGPCNRSKGGKTMDQWLLGVPKQPRIQY